MAMRPSSKAMSFGEAFKAARAAGDSKFDWGGKSYTTEMAAPGGPGRKPTPRVRSSDLPGPGRRNPSNPDYGNEGRTAAASLADENFSNEGRGAAAKLADENFSNEGRGYKRGGRVTGYRGYGKAKKV